MRRIDSNRFVTYSEQHLPRQVTGPTRGFVSTITSTGARVVGRRSRPSCEESLGSYTRGPLKLRLSTSRTSYFPSPSSSIHLPIE